MEFTINPSTPPFFEKDNRTPPYITHNIHNLYPRQLLALHCHKHAELGICLSGSGYSYIQNRIYRYKTGDMQFVSSHTPHLSNSDFGVISKWLWISLDFVGLFSTYIQENAFFFSSLESNCFNGTFHPYEHKKLAEIAYSFQELFANPDKFAFWRELFLAGQLLMEVASIGDIDAQDTPTYEKKLLLYPTVMYIQKNYWNKEAMKEENLAKLSQYSVSHFRYLFKKEVGIPLQEFILKTRLSYAAYALTSSKDSILQIALDAGFGNISYFNRSFFKFYQCTPSAYRKNNKES